MPFFKHVLLNLGFVQLQVYEEPTDWGNYTYTRDVLRDARGEVLVVGLPHLSTFKIFSSAKCARATEELLERIAAHLQGKSFLPSGKIPESQSLSVFKPPARRSRPAATKKVSELGGCRSDCRRTGDLASAKRAPRFQSNQQKGEYRCRWHTAPGDRDCAGKESEAQLPLVHRGHDSSGERF